MYLCLYGSLFERSDEQETLSVSIEVFVSGVEGGFVLVEDEPVFVHLGVETFDSVDVLDVLLCLFDSGFDLVALYFGQLYKLF